MGRNSCHCHCRAEWLSVMQNLFDWVEAKAAAAHFIHSVTETSGLSAQSPHVSPVSGLLAKVATGSVSLVMRAADRWRENSRCPHPVSGRSPVSSIEFRSARPAKCSAGGGCLQFGG